ncbi:MAG: hypothetical protein M3O62_17105 [Pseudomonadota bacterium]|nr:hypothetical protein [Pseudomonadota bacterium]
MRVQSMKRIRLFVSAILAMPAYFFLPGCGDSNPVGNVESASQPPPPGGFAADGSLVAGAVARDCFWAVTEEMNYANIFYLEKYANYWISALAIPPGGHIRIRGEFPHSRYMSFNIYSPTFKPIGVLSDIDIHPNAGSMNPFISGADRNAENRAFSIRVLPEFPPDTERAPNTLYNYLPLNGLSATIEELLPIDLLGIPLPSNILIMIYRVYLPDTTMSRSGGVDLPDIEIVDGAGNIIAGPDVCDFLEPTLPTLVNDVLENAELGPINLGLSVPPSTAALPETKWFKYFDLLSTYIHHYEAVPGIAQVPELSALDFARNLDNSYLMGYVSQRYGELVSLDATVPSHRNTVRGESGVSDTQARYFSFCSNDFYTRRLFDCVYDEEIPVVDSKAIVLVGRKAMRPSNATFGCGVAWLNWGLFEESMLAYRQMTPGEDDVFPQAIKNIPLPSGDHEEEVMGEYYPKSKYWTKEAFERLGCPVTHESLRSHATR